MPVIIDIAAFCQDHRISQKAIAEKIDVHPSFISEIAKGRRKMPESAFLRLIDEYGEDEVNPYVKSALSSATSISNAGNSCVIGGGDVISVSPETLEHLTEALKQQTALTREALSLADSLQKRLGEALELALGRENSNIHPNT